jgi:putative transcriptional regulator
MEVAVKNKIRELRGAKGWSQADLAEKLDVSRQSVNAVETGKFDPSLPLAFRIARLFGKKIEDVFDDGRGSVKRAAE